MGDDEPAGDETVDETEVSEGESTTSQTDDEFPVIDQDIDWDSCVGEYECTTILVPLDYDEPDGETIELAVTRWRAFDEDNRIGTLFVNPGGPGFGTDFYVQSIASFAPLELSDQFDIVGIDPRGTGGSNAIDCNSDWEDEINTPVTLDDGLADDVEVEVEEFEEAAAECLDQYGEDFLAAITTENVARDHESVRLLLGGEPMNFLGASYGTTLGSVYATLFPDNIRALVLDGAVLPDAGFLQVEEFEDLALQLERLEASCEAWTECPLPGGFIAAADELEAALIKGPIGPLTLGEFYNAVGVTYAAPGFLPDVALGMSQALDGDGTELASINDFLLTPLPGSGNPAEYAGGLAAIHCADGIKWAAVDSADLLSVAEDTALAYPEIGPYFGIPCDLWPVQGDGLPSIDYQGDAPVLVIGNTGDAITPLRYAEQMAEAFGEQARLLTWDATGHVAFTFGSACIDESTTEFLIDLTLPPEGTVCALQGFIGVELELDNRVTSVFAGTPAAEAGFQRGDRVVVVNGDPVVTFDDFPPLIAGEPATFVVLREDERVELEATPDFPEWELWRSAE